MIEGPDLNYTVTGYMEHAITVGLLSAQSLPQGYKEITFKDGQKIRHNLTSDNIYNLLMGTIGHQITGKIEFRDEGNNLYGYYEIGAYRLRK